MVVIAGMVPQSIAGSCISCAAHSGCLRQGCMAAVSSMSVWTFSKALAWSCREMQSSMETVRRK
eukprot:15442246-Alexandrium_andersonii.AAC.1